MFLTPAVAVTLTVLATAIAAPQPEGTCSNASLERTAKCICFTLNKLSAAAQTVEEKSSIPKELLLACSDVFSSSKDYSAECGTYTSGKDGKDALDAAADLQVQQCASTYESSDPDAGPDGASRAVAVQADAIQTTDRLPGYCWYRYPWWCCAYIWIFHGYWPLWWKWWWICRYYWWAYIWRCICFWWWWPFY